MNFSWLFHIFNFSCSNILLFSFLLIKLLHFSSKINFPRKKMLLTKILKISKKIFFLVFLKSNLTMDKLEKSSNRFRNWCIYLIPCQIVRTAFPMALYPLADCPPRLATCLTGNFSNGILSDWQTGCWQFFLLTNWLLTICPNGQLSANKLSSVKLSPGKVSENHE